MTALKQRPPLNIIDRFDDVNISIWEVYHAAQEHIETAALSYNTFSAIIRGSTNPRLRTLLIVARILGLEDREFLEEQGIMEAENIPSMMISNLYNKDICFRFEESTGKVIAYDTTKYKLTTIKVQK